MVCITETECVYCAVRTKRLRIIKNNVRVIAHAVSRQPLTAEARVRFQCSPCGKQSDTGEFFLPVLQFSPVSIIPPLFHTHSFNYHPRCILFFSQHFSNSPVSIIPPLLHTHSVIYHPRCIMFFSQHFSIPLSVSFHHCSIPIQSSTTHAV